MTTHDQDHGVQPGAEKDGAFASEQPRDAQDMNAYSADELLEAITRDPESSESATTSPASVQPPGQESEEQDQGKKEKSLRLRLSALPPDQQHETAEAYRLVSEGKAADLLEALQQLRGVTAASSTPANAQDDDGTDTPPDNVQSKPSAIQELENQLEGLRSQRKLARDEFDSDLEDQLTVEIENLSRRIAKEEIKAETQQKGIEQAENQFRSEYSAAVEELESQYPDVLDDNSEFTALLDEKLAAARYRNDPKLANPRYILELAQSVHALLDKPSGRRPSPPPAVPRPTGAGVAPVHNQPPRPTEDQLRAAINQASPEDLLAYIAGT